MNNLGILMQSVKNPQQFLQNAMQNSQLMQNPIAKNAIEMYQRGDKDGINQMAQNLCKEKGVKPEEIINQLKSQFGL
jgi:ABC-type tungstate transport system permease subunit